MANGFYRVIVLIFVSLLILSLLLSSIGRLRPDQLVAYTYVNLAHDPRIMLIDLNTGSTLEISHETPQTVMNARAPQWSPDGSRMAFRSYLNRRGDIAVYEYSLNQNRYDDLTSRYGFITLPIYTPASEKILFSQQLAPNVPLLLMRDETSSEILVESAQGTPQWSPDGRFLAYRAQLIPQVNDEVGVDEDSDSETANQAVVDVYLLDTLTGEHTNLTETVATFGDPQWSPDGSRVLFVAEGTISHIHVIDVMTGDVSVYDDVVFGQAAWSPDGEHIAFTMIANQGNLDIHILTLATDEMRRLTSHPFYDIQPTWSPDSRTIAFISHRHGQDDLFTANIATGEMRRITYTRGDERDPVWRP